MRNDEGKNYNAVDVAFPYVVACTDRTLAVLKRCGLSLMNEFYTDMVMKASFDQRGCASVEGEFVGLPSEFSKFRSVVE